jgi:diguanylate cyclase
MDQTLFLLMIASFFVCSIFLWLAVQTAEAAKIRSSRAARALTVGSVLLATCGLWWPSHVMHLGDAQLLSWLPALLMAFFAYYVGWLWRRGQEPWAAFATTVMVLLIYAHIMVNVPGMARAIRLPDWLAAGMSALSLSTMLISTQFRFGNKLVARGICAAAVFSASFTVSWVAAVAAPLAATRSLLIADWVLVLTLAMSLGLMLFVLRTDKKLLNHQGDSPIRSTTRPPRGSTASDTLTGLSNRRHFESRLHRAARECDANSSKLSVLFIDLDCFKPINGSFGHAGGDLVLKQVGQRLKALTISNGVAARVSGDEFVLLSVGLDTREATAALCRRVIDALSKPYAIEEREISISCSVGIAPYPEKCDANKLIARAEAAMMSAKRAGGARHCFYSPEMNADVQQNFDLLNELRQAIVKDELELFFQPKIDATSGKITAAEALVRWNHPARGLVMPGQFIPLAERSGLIIPLGNWVIEAACKQARSWRDKGLRMRVAINLSAYQMRQEDIVERIADALGRYRIRPSLLTCEITETAAMEDTRATQETFRRLGELGAHLSIDDFGTGYSSLSYLRQLPAKELKIDGSFVRDLDFSNDARAIIDAVVRLAHALGLKVVAEGVENQRQQKILVELGCDELQGYLFAQPMSARALLLWAMDDRTVALMFRASLFDETQTDKSLQSASPPGQSVLNQSAQQSQLHQVRQVEVRK